MILIYRLEFNGTGIYNSGIANIIKGTNRHPCIERDEKLKKSIGKNLNNNFLFYNNFFIFAFADIRQLVKWFNHYERNQLRKQSKKYSNGNEKIKLLTIKIFKKYVKYGDYQVIFNKNKGEIISIKDF